MELARNVQAAASTNARFDHIIVHGVWNRAQWCGRIDHTLPQRLANRTPRTHHANTSFWRSH
eukprot:6162221-Lingulodinium_polyedra.AAC.1